MIIEDSALKYHKKQKKNKTGSAKRYSPRKKFSTEQIMANTGAIDSSLLKDFYFSTTRDSAHNEVDMHQMNLETLQKKKEQIDQLIQMEIDKLEQKQIIIKNKSYGKSFLLTHIPESPRTKPKHSQSTTQNSK